MVSPTAKQVFIQGITQNGRTFRPSDWAERLAAGPPLALQMSKRMLNSGLQMSLSEMLHWEAMAQSVTSTSRDAMEAMKAFAEKRLPEFKGR